MVENMEEIQVHANRRNGQAAARQDSNFPTRTLLILFGLWLVFPSVTVFAGPNLVVNGIFEDPKEPLSGWKTKYDAKGESWYYENHTKVSVVREEAGRKNVLRLYGTYRDVFEIGQGVKTDSNPIPWDPESRYRFSAWAKSTGPNCRILLQGYKWKPKVKPHDNPKLSDLRRCYRFKQLFFGIVKAGEMGGVKGTWDQASRTIPEGKLSDLARRKYGEIKFVVVHIVGIGEHEGELFVDDVVLKKLN